MKKLTLLTLVVLSISSAHAKKNCTDQSKDKWLSVDAFKEKAIADGYTIRKFKQPGSCYEIYGINKEGKKVEVYFNPVDGSVVKSKFE